MLPKEVSKQVRILEKDLERQVAANTKLELDIAQAVQSVFEVSGCQQEFRAEGFDMEGDNDLLKLNFGGRNFDIKRSVLTKPQFGRNLFSCLFQKRWDRFHVRDKKGRIYVDLNKEWLIPLIEYMKSSHEEEVGNRLAASNCFLLGIMKDFRMDNLFSLQFTKSKLSLHGLEDSQLRTFHSSAGFRADIRGSFLSNHEDCLGVDCNLIYSFSADGKKCKPLAPDYDLRFKTFLLFIKMNDGQSFSHLHSANQTLSVVEPEDTIGTKKVSSVDDFFPVNVSSNDGTVVKILFHDTNPGFKLLEIYEYQPNCYKPKIKRRSSAVSCEETEEENSAQQLDNMILSNSEKVFHVLRKFEDDWLKEKSLLEKKLENLQTENQFFADYFWRAWFPKDISDTENLIGLLEMIIQRKNLPQSDPKKSRKKRKSTEEQTDSEPEPLDPIVYFNVEGEIFPVLRSTILRVIPDSQLAVRVSGRWEEHEEKGDIDEEGNLIANCHSESFRQILAGLQAVRMGTKTLIIFVTALCRNYIEETLCYLQITPDKLIYID
jgi:hypothetical protein